MAQKLEPGDVSLWDSIESRHIQFVIDAACSSWEFKPRYSDAMATAIEKFSEAEGHSLPSRDRVLQAGELEEFIK